MIFNDLREWLAEVKKMNEVAEVHDASLDDELGTLVDIYQQEMEKPCLLFDQIPGYQKGYRVLANSCSSMKRVALTFNMPVEYDKYDIIQEWRQFLKSYKPIKPEIVDTGTVMENQFTGGQVDLSRIPVPIWHPEDGGRYIGTGGFVVTKDPDSDWVNCGGYRLMMQGKDKVNVMIVKGKHGDIMRNKYWKHGKPMPIAASLGQDPLYYLISGMEIPYEESEYDFIGAIRKRPVKLINSPIYGLPVPADGEIVIEGEVWPDETLPEGPFGEWTGYYAGGVRDTCVMRVKGLYYRNDPILLGAIPSIPPSEINYYRCPLRSATIWDQLESAGIPGISSVWAHEVGGARMLIIVAIKQLYPAHSTQVGLITSQCHAAAYANKAVIVVDDDVDPTNLNEVIWATLTRADPAEDIEILTKCWTSKVDPTSYPPGGNYYNNRVVINACRTWGKMDDFPPVIKMDPAVVAKVQKKWPQLF